MSNSVRCNIKIRRLQEEMDRVSMDAVVALSPENFAYVTGVSILTHQQLTDMPAIAVVPRNGEPVVIVFRIEENYTRRESLVQDVRIYELGDRERTNGADDSRRSHIEQLAAIINELGLARSRIGLELDYFVPVSYFRKMKSMLPKVIFETCDSLFERVRAVKTEYEIENLRLGALATERAVLEGFGSAKLGDTEKQLADNVRSRLFEAGAEDFWATLGAGPNVKMFHQRPGNKQLMAGEPVHFDGGGRFNGGYYSDISRMAIGKGYTGDQMSRYHWLRESMHKTLSRFRAGMACAEIYTAAKADYDKAGFDIMSEVVGHGIGLGLHEWPVMHANEKAVLKPGMVMAIEQGLDDGTGSRHHIEDLVLVTEGEPVLLSDYAPTEEPVIIE